MKLPTHPPDEAGRLAALRAFQILDTAPETDFDDLTSPRIFAARASRSSVSSTPTESGANHLSELLRTIRRCLDS